MVVNITNSSIDKLHAFVEQHLPPKKLESKMFGEVFTPLSLVDEMLTAVEKYGNKNIWKNPNIKILDPAAGIGNFPLIAYKKLMKGLEHIPKYKDDECRRKHILENMLYMVELNPTNVRLMRRIFGSKKYKLNIVKGDFFNKKTTDTLLTLLKANELKFDVVMGNPPFNDGSGNKGKGHTLWTVFLETALKSLLKEEAFLAFITPSLWRQADHELFTLMKSKQLLYLEIHDVKDGLSMFKSSTRYDWYIVRNSKAKAKTVLKDEDGKEYKNIHLKDWAFLPNSKYSEINNLIARGSEERCNILHSESDYEPRQKWMSNVQTTEFKYPCIYSINVDNKTSLKYSSIITRGHFGIPKVIFSNGMGTIIDTNGKYGLTQWASGIVDDKRNLQGIYNCLTNPKFKEIILAINLSSDAINWRIMKYFKKDFWKYYN